MVEITPVYQGGYLYGCGHACVAMLLGISFEEAVEKIGHTTTTSKEEIEKALGVEGFQWFSLGKPASGYPAICHRKNPKADQWHWTVWDGKKTICPARIGSGMWPIEEWMHINIDCARQNQQGIKDVTYR